MDKVKLDKLRDHTNEITDIMFRAQSSFKIVDFLYRQREGLETEIINRNSFLLYTADVNWRIYVTEVSKLFAKRNNEHYNVHKFIKKFKEGEEYETDEIPLNSIKIWEANLSQEKEEHLIKNLLEQRDKKFSHTDKDANHIGNEFTFIDAKEFLHIVQRILSEIYQVVFKTTMLFNPTNEPVDELKKIVAMMVNEMRETIKFDEMLNDSDFDEKIKKYGSDKDGMAKWYHDL